MADRQETLGSFRAKLLEEAVVQEFAANLRGELLRPEDDGYDTARAVFNGMIDRHPALIARCAGEADVIRGVDFASRVDPGATAFPHRDEHYDLVILSDWTDSTDTAKNIEWTRAFYDAMQPFSERGVYVNNLGEEGEDRVRAAYGLNYDRLTALKNKYDPTNLFRLNQNIKPIETSS